MIWFLIHNRQALLADATHEASTTIQATKIQKRQTLLLRRIQGFMKTQLIFMPGLSGYLASRSEPTRTNSTNPEKIRLYLPSSIPETDRDTVCAPGIADIEDQLRYAQAIEALSGLRWHLRTQIIASKHHDKHGSSQRMYTRSRALRDQVESRIRTCQKQYNLARHAVFALRGPGNWERVLAILKPEDVRGINERALTEEERSEHRHTEEIAGFSANSHSSQLPGTLPTATFNPQLALGEGRQTLSWIWYSVSDQELQEDSPEVEASVYFHGIS
jgi:hypothetical protein